MSTSAEGESSQNSSSVVVTTFADNGEVVGESFTSKIDTMPIPRVEETVESFMRRPKNVLNTIMQTTDLPNANLYHVIIESLLASVPEWAEKIHGYGLVRGTACFKVLTNANPFQCGKLLSVWLPQANQAVNATYAALHNGNLVCRYQLPSVELDLRDSGSVMKIPYIAPTSWYSIKSDSKYPQYGWGTFDVCTLSPLLVGTGTDNTVPVSIWAWFEDFELAMPTITQSSGGGRGRAPVKSFGRNVTAEEASSIGVDAVSSGLRSVSMAANALASIPSFAPIAGPAAWVSDVGAGVASAFGWEKPDLNPAPSVMVRQYNRFLATSDGVDSAIPVSLKTNHGVTPSDGASIRSVDEMSWSFLKSVETVTNADGGNQLFWADTDAVGHSLASLLVCPRNTTSAPYAPSAINLITRNTHQSVSYSGPPFFFLASKFKQYRGSLQVRLKFPKTDFHTGRLLIVWTPGHNIGTPATLTNSLFSLKEIVDLRDGNEVCLNLPWMLEYNYLNVDDYYGSLDILVLNTLRRPDTASSKIQILTYWSGGPDLEFALPNGTAVGGHFTEQVFTTEMDSTTSAVEEIICEPVGGGSEQPFSMIAAEQSMGEVFTDLKQLIGRYNLWYSNSNVATSATIPTVMIWPWSSNTVGQDHTTGLLNNAGIMGGDMYNFVAPMYAYYRGDMKIAITQSETISTAPELVTNNPIYAMLLPGEDLGGTVEVNALNNNYNSVTTGPYSSVVKNWHNNYSSTLTQSLAPAGVGLAITDAGVGYSNWRVPYYARTKLSMMWPGGLTVGGVPNDVSQSLGSILLHGAVGTWNDYLLARAVADDFHFHFFLGAPPVLFDWS